ncbi:MAG: vitamin B12-dependent ribonucleotide reductase [Planctomycetia bacterium]|nr:vitamin B12-dependent ribonucleotide reductase [Planctomycetia bacterium]
MGTDMDHSIDTKTSALETADFTSTEDAKADLETDQIESDPVVPKREKIARDRKSSRKNGLHIKPLFCDPKVADPFDTVEWGVRNVAIKGDKGGNVFEQNDCEIPVSWTDLAAKVVISKYFYGEAGTAEREKSVRQLIHRVCRSIADWGVKDGYFATKNDGENFYRDLAWLCLHQYVAFNSPVWFNVGLYQMYHVNGAPCNWHWSAEAGEATQPQNPYEFPQASACFIQNVEDNMESIMNLASSEALLFKFGSGTGTDLSTIRSCREKLSGGGKPSGPLSFMRVYDQIAAVVKSGGKTRRAAKMQSLKVWHPDIMDFIDCKYREEQKARILVRDGLSNDDAYSSVLFQNANLSVRVTDSFMEAVKNDQPWSTHWVTDSEHVDSTMPARDVYQKISDTAWACGDPGLQYDTTINRWHTCPNSGRINASNPCSEYMFLDNSACNLASCNLMRFREEGGRFNYERFTDACRLIYIAQDILVDNASYPIKKIAENSHRYRPLGLGYSNLGSLIMSLGLPYDSDEARGLCSSITALLHGTAMRTSAELAGIVGPFDAFADNRDSMNNVMDMHWEAVNHIKNSPNYLKRAAQELWDDVIALGQKNGYRNAQGTVLAPTGTISFMMDCDTTGIEPDIALVKFKQLAGGGNLRIVNRTVPLALETLGYGREDIAAIVKYIEETGMIEGAPGFLNEHLPVFDCAFPTPGGMKRCISWEGHVRMMAAAQPFISGAISKTVNLPSTATVQDIKDAYMLGWELGLKALAVYRDGSKAAQPLSTSGKDGKKEEKDLAAVQSSLEGTEVSESAGSRRRKRLVGSPRRERLPDTRQSVTHKFNVAGHEGYITVGLYPDNRVGELFITMAKEGSTIGGLMDCFSTALSMSLQYGVPLKAYVEKFSHTRFEPMGYTKNPDIPMAKSLVDYIFRWLGSTFLHEPAVPALPHDNHGAEMNGMNGLNGFNGQSNPAPEMEYANGDKIKGPRAAKHDGLSMPVSDLAAGSGNPSSNRLNPKEEVFVPGNAVPSNAPMGSNTAPYGSSAAYSGSPIPYASHPNEGLVFRTEGEHTSHGPYLSFENGVATMVIEPTYNAESEESDSLSEQFANFQSDAPACDSCGAICVRSGNCYLCHNCGRSMGCS